MTHMLPPNLQRLFTPRPPVDYVTPLHYDKNPMAKPENANPKKARKLTGVSEVLERVKQEAADRGEATDADADMKFSLTEQTKREIRREEKKKQVEEEKKHNPKEDAHTTGDPFKTLFIGRLSYEVAEDDLRKEFDRYGPIEVVRLVTDQEGKSRGYAFIVYEREKDMRAAYKSAEGMKLRGRRILVDVERGRTVTGWKPMRLGGGLGGSARKPKKPVEPEPFMGGASIIMTRDSFWRPCTD
ncbi:RNA-binding domain-containing protein [Tilletiaria anomala UBC 951]|uniref:RNA-binding domain-containing protein n=1 Tax=Tilletiaria anomala (strain ATCC 24038 / CBS 436.72 / UBC 951) TaxID=1037660 RepID=A0A066WPN7_TILAU|nr:RNA-binding domain-containing protein [Tilletiaria anomala UBC 951]KDN52954.1 RNA-binding domain-containing protein [Tilletiaria anomala UBC 951]